jgi:hypothetical protein
MAESWPPPAAAAVAAVEKKDFLKIEKVELPPFEKARLNGP